MNTSTAGSADAPAKTAAQIAQQARHRRAQDLLRRLAIWVVLPTTLAAIYLYGIARNQYESVATVMVRNGNGAHIVMLEQFLMSRDTLAKLDKKLSFSQHYAEKGDFVFGLSRKAGNESRFKLYRSFANVSHDPATSVITVSVRAFSAKHAHDAVRAIVDEGQAFLSGLDAAQSGQPLVVLATPSLPNEASYPRRAYGVLTAFFVSLSVFVIGALMIAAVREHAQF